jgi:salicylate 5-hydroxylase small subunit
MTDVTAVTAVTDFQTYLGVQALHARYAQILDSADFSAWPDLFTPVCSYTVQSRENHDAGLPLCILRMESQGMLRDRVYGALKTIYHDPYYQRHIVSQPLITQVDGDSIHADTGFLVLRTHRDRLPEILATGRYIDRMVRTPEGLRFAQRHCIFDNDLIANSLIKPL